MKKHIIKFINKLPYVRGLVKDIEKQKNDNRFKSGHYHSPIPDPHEIEQHYSILTNTVNDIYFDFTNQKEILDNFVPFYKEMPWDFTNDTKNKNLRYKNSKSYYRYSDAIFLYSMIRKFKPDSIIEVGSGFSSAIMLDTNELFFKTLTKILFL